MTCRDFIGFLAEYLEQTLPAQQREEFDRHLAICPDCLNYMASYRRTIELSRSLADSADASIADQAPQELIDAILAARNKQDE